MGPVRSVIILVPREERATISSTFMKYFSPEDWLSVFSLCHATYFPQANDVVIMSLTHIREATNVRRLSKGESLEFAPHTLHLVDARGVGLATKSLFMDEARHPDLLTVVLLHADEISHLNCWADRIICLATHNSFKDWFGEMICEEVAQSTGGIPVIFMEGSIPTVEFIGDFCTKRPTPTIDL